VERGDIRAHRTSRTGTGVEVTEICYPETGEGMDGLFVEATISETRSSVLAQTRCAAGYYAQISRDSVPATSSPSPSPLP
jgi:hypothetical protein